MALDEKRVTVTLDDNPNLNITLDTREHLGSASLTDEDKYAARQLGIPGADGPIGPQGDAGIIWKGDWNASQIYNLQDGVKYEGSVYIYINPSSTSGFVPTNTLYWDLFVEKGDTGDQGSPGADFALVAEYTQEPTGFDDRNDSVVTYNNTSRQMSISPAIDNYAFMVAGELHLKTVTDSVVWDDVEGLHNFYFDVDGILHTQQPFQGLKDYAFVSFIYWDATNKVVLHTAEERHGMVMDWKTHEYLHNTVGTKYDKGLGIAFTIGDGSDDADNTVELTDGIVWDEDLDHHITNGVNGGYFIQPLSPIAKLPVWHRTGEQDWRKSDATDYPFGYTPNVGPLYNLKSGVEWSAAQVPNNNYTVCWIVATNDIHNPVVVIMGQHYSNTITKTLELNALINIDFGVMPTPESKLLYRLVLRHKDSYIGATRTYIAEVADLRLTVDKAQLDESGSTLTTIGDKSYEHIQSVASDIWVITHNLEKNPSVTVIDTGSNEVEGSVTYDDINNITITFTAAFTGNAYLN